MYAFWKQKQQHLHVRTSEMGWNTERDVLAGKVWTGTLRVAAHLTSAVWKPTSTSIFSEESYNIGAQDWNRFVATARASGLILF